MLRLMLTSGTYRQASRVRPGLRDRDPENRLLARGPRGERFNDTARHFRALDGTDRLVFSASREPAHLAQLAEQLGLPPPATDSVKR